MTQAQAIALGLKALAAANEHKLKSEIIEIGVVSAKQDFHTLDQADVKKAVAKAK
jgi:20S proteasome alpha/beta subunit